MLDFVRERADNRFINASVALVKRSAYRFGDGARLRAVRRADAWADGDVVSVIIPTYRRRDILMERALPSVLSQSHIALEVIVAVHGDGDDTADAVRSIADERIVVVEVSRKRLGYPNKAEYHWLAGPTRPINAGLAAVTGAWIARIDDDDVWKPQHIERSLSFARSGEYEFVSSTYIAKTPTQETILGGDDGVPIGGVQTWLYRSSLHFFRANIDAWRKNWNRGNDTDIQERMLSAGVHVGFRDDVDPQVIVEARPGEMTVGSAAYLRDPKRIEREMRA